MKVDIKKLDKLKRKIKVEVFGQEFLKEKKELCKAFAKKLKVPGFRPGSAPLEIIEKHHAGFLREELLKNALPLFYGRALRDAKLAPVSEPQVSGVALEKEGLSFEAEFEIRPEVEINDSVYKGIKVKAANIEVKEIEVEKVLTNIKENIKKNLKKDLDDSQLSKWASYPDIASFREAIKIQISIEKLRQRRQDIEAGIREHLLKSVKLELPRAEVDNHFKQLLQQEAYNLRLKGVSEEDLKKYTKDLEAKLKPRAADEVKLYYILEAIAGKEGIKIDNNLGEAALGLILSEAQY